MGYKIDLTGERYGKLTVIGYSHQDKGRKSHWKCKCDCGKEIAASGSNLRCGNTSSCGCGEVENRKRRMDRFYEEHTTHCLSATRLNRTYRHMKGRCYNPHDKDYHLYGGRGIAVCDEWLGADGFQHFYDWAMASGYADNLSIDRIDTNAGYSPSNCRWATDETQANNRRNNVLYDIGSGAKTLAQLCKEHGVKYHKARDRLKSGWPIKQALGIEKRA